MTGYTCVKAIILVAGPQKGTRFRPLSLEVPKPLFPVGGYPLLEHHIAACTKVKAIKEVILLGYYQSSEQISRFIDDMRRKYKMQINISTESVTVKLGMGADRAYMYATILNKRYLQEYKPLGTAGGLYHFRDHILSPGTEAVVVIHGDIICKIPIEEMLQYSKECNSSGTNKHVVLGTRAFLTNTPEHGNMVIDEKTNELTHYVEKPEHSVSSVINCGVYVFHPSVQHLLADLYQHQLELAQEQVDEQGEMSGPEYMFVGRHLFTHLAGQKQVYCFKLSGFWGSMKSAGSAIFANRQYLSTYHLDDSGHVLASNGPGQPTIIGDVFIHPTAIVDPSAKIGPNVSIGSHCVIGAGARVKESIILDDAELREHCCVLNSIIGWRCLVGAWSRVEGTLNDPNPNNAGALVPNESLFHADGKLVPSVTVLGCNVIIPREVIVLNCIVLPHKELSGCYKNQIIL